MRFEKAIPILDRKLRGPVPDISLAERAEAAELKRTETFGGQGGETVEGMEKCAS